MNEYLIHCKGCYFTNIICPIIALFIFGFSWKRKNPNLIIFKYYLIFYVIESALNAINIIFFYKTDLYHYSMICLKSETVIFTVFEFFVFARYFEIISLPSSRKIGRTISFLYVLSTTVPLIQNESFFTSINFNILDRIFTIQSIALVALCVVYYFELFKNLHFDDLSVEPSFWIFTGLFFCMLCTLPLNFLFPYLKKNNFLFYSQLFSIVNVFYLLLFLMIAKAFLCSPTSK